MTLGVLDWGIGGLWATRRALQREPTLDIIYVSDAGAAPYGLQPRRPLARRVERAIGWLADAGATEVLVACHSASSILPVTAPLPVHGVIVPPPLPPGRIGVIGGRRTILSGVWLRALAGRTVQQRIAQPLSAFVEAGQADSEACRAALDRILAPLRVDVTVLACTHYAALRGQIAARAGAVVDPVDTVVDSLSLVPGSRRFEVWTTGSPESLERAARRALDWPLRARRLEHYE